MFLGQAVFRWTFKHQFQFQLSDFIDVMVEKIKYYYDKGTLGISASLERSRQGIGEEEYEQITKGLFVFKKVPK